MYWAFSGLWSKVQSVTTRATNNNTNETALSVNKQKFDKGFTRLTIQESIYNQNVPDRGRTEGVSSCRKSPSPSPKATPLVIFDDARGEGLDEMRKPRTRSGFYGGGLRRTGREETGGGRRRRRRKR